MREEGEGMPCFHVKPPKSQPLLDLPSGTLGEMLTVCTGKQKASEFYLAFSGLWRSVSFCETMELGKSGYFAFPLSNRESLLTSPSPECDVSSESTVRMKLAPPGRRTDARVSNTHIYLQLPRN